MTIQASGEPGLVRPIKEAVEKSIKSQIDKSYGVETPSENRQLTGHEGNVPTREETITKVSSADFYDEVGRSLLSILEKRAAKIPPQFLAGGGAKKKDEEEEDKGKKGKKNNLPPFMKTKGEKEEKDEEEEEEEEEEGKPKKGKAKKGKKEEEEEEPKFPIFGKKPKKAE